MKDLVFILFLIACSINVAFSAKIKRVDECRQIYSENEFIVSQNKTTKAVLDADGNLNVFSDGCCNKAKKDVLLWSSNTKGVGTAPRKLVLEPNGNLVIYDSKGTSVWNTGVAGNPQGPFSIQVTDEGKLAVKDGQNKSLFSTFNTRLVRNVRYVKVLSGNRPESYLQISQLVVRNEKGENVAKGKPFSASLQFDAGAGTYALDGVEESREAPFFYHSALLPSTFFEVDLVNDTDVDSVEYFNRKDGINQDRMIGAKILLIDSQFKVLRESEITTADLKVVFGYASPPKPAVRDIRYVKLIGNSNKDSALQISQLVVKNEYDVNVARGKTVFFNSILEGTTPCEVTNGQEVLKSYPFLFHSALLPNQYLSVDLTQNENISKVVLYNRGDCCKERIKGVKVQLQNSSRDVVKEYTIGDVKDVIEITTQ